MAALQASSLKIDHIIIAVTNREEAASEFRSLGFTVVVGGTHPGGHTHNMLIVLSDGVYLELVAPTKLEYIQQKHEDHGRHWLFVFNAGQGFVGYALRSAHIEDDIARIRQYGFPIEDAHMGGRILPDGRETVSKGTSITGKRYPSVVEDVTPRHWRAPNDVQTITHVNGASGVASMVALIRDFDEGVRRYEAVLGVSPRPGTSVDGAKTADFHLETSVITVAAPTDPHSPMYADLIRRGEVPYLVRLRTNNKNAAGMLEPVSTREARIELVE